MNRWAIDMNAVLPIAPALPGRSLMFRVTCRALDRFVVRGYQTMIAPPGREAVVEYDAGTVKAREAAFHVVGDVLVALLPNFPAGLTVLATPIGIEVWDISVAGGASARIQRLGPAETFEFAAAGDRAPPPPSANQTDPKDAAMNEPAAAPVAMLSCEAAARLQSLARELAAGSDFKAADALALATLAERGRSYGLDEALLSVSGQ